MVKVKICGITNLKDAQEAVKAGCDALGFVFYQKSPRYISPEDAGEIIRKLPGNILRVGVFVNARENFIKTVAKSCALNLLQLHGDESPEFCARFKKYRLIKAFRIRKKLVPKDILKYRTEAYLFDGFSSNSYGGTGKKFSWALLKKLGPIRQEFFLSGGLNLKNVRLALREVNPSWVDVSSSLEISPGKKDPLKVINFIKVVKKSKGRKNVTR